MHIGRRTVGAGILGAGLALPPARAQPAWPARPIRFIVPWPPGGLNDLVARHFNDRVAALLPAAVVNDFRPGAGGRVGVAELARAAPDGHTIGMGNLGPLTIFPNLYRDLQYDVARDLAPVAMFAASPLVLVVQPGLPAASVPELVALARARAGRLNYASVGIGTAQHLLFEMLFEGTGAAMEHVPYRGLGDSMLAITAGDVVAMFDTLPSMLGPLRDGRLRALAVTTPDRVAALPDVPTLAEAGSPLDVVTWYGVIAPAQTPVPILDRLHAAYTAVSESAETGRFLNEQGLIHLPSTRAGFTQRIAAESERWGRIIRDRNIRVG